MITDKDKKKLTPFNHSKFMKGISAVESGGGKYMKNPTSSASGLYGQLFNSLPQDFLDARGVADRDAFIADTSAQNAYMRTRISGDMSKDPRKTNLLKDASDLEREYKPQLGQKYKYRIDEAAALSHYLGRQGARNYMGSLRDNKPYTPPGVNKSPEDYLSIYNNAIKAKGGDMANLKALKAKGGPVKRLKPKTGGYTSREEMPDVYDRLAESYEYKPFGRPRKEAHVLGLTQPDYLNFIRDYKNETTGLIEDYNTMHGTNYDLRYGREKFNKKINSGDLRYNKEIKYKDIPPGTSRGTKLRSEEYGFGGWLKENAGTIGTIGGAIIGGPAGAALGSAIGGAISGIDGEAEELAPDYTIPQALPKQHYQRAASGLNLGKMTEYGGESHEMGGMQLGGMPVEVEGGETRTNDMIHSDRIKVTKEMVKNYPALKRSDIGKTMADITKLRHKKFEKRKWDELNDNAAELALMPYEQISDDLAPAPEENMMAAGGGDISAQKARMILSHGRIRGKAITDKQRKFFGAKSKMAGGGELLNMLGQYGPIVASGLDMVGALAGGPEEVDYGKASFAPAKVNYASSEPGIQNIRKTFGNVESKLRKYNPGRYLARMADIGSQEADAVTGHAGNIQGMNVQASNQASMLDAQNATRTNMFNKQVGIQEAQANAANRAAWQGRISGDLANMGTISGQMSRDQKLQAEDTRQFDKRVELERERMKYLYGDPSGSGTPRDEQVIPEWAGYNPDVIPDLASNSNIAGDANLLGINDFDYSYLDKDRLPPLQKPYLSFARGGDLARRLRLRKFKTM